MTRIIEVKLQCKIHDDGDRTYLVVARHGDLGESAPNQILFDGHFGKDALKELQKAMVSVMAEDLHALTLVSDSRKEFNNIPLGYSFTRISLKPEAETFTCPKCGAVSHNPDDVKNSYCGACHQFFGELERLNR